MAEGGGRVRHVMRAVVCVRRSKKAARQAVHGCMREDDGTDERGRKGKYDNALRNASGPCSARRPGCLADEVTLSQLDEALLLAPVNVEQPQPLGATGEVK
jgi:hypothetical protein